MGNILSIDIETTGLNEKTCQVIEVAAVIDNIMSPMVPAPEFHCYVQHKLYQGEPYALSMHPKIFRRLAITDPTFTILEPKEVWDCFENWLNILNQYSDNGKWTVSGKNYAGFDERFLRLLPGWNDSRILRHRVLDPGSLWFDPIIDNCLPDTSECCKRAGIDSEVSHTALEDANQVMELVRRYYEGQ